MNMDDAIRFDCTPNFRQHAILTVRTQMLRFRGMLIISCALIAIFVLWPLVVLFLNSQQASDTQVPIKMPWAVLILPAFVLILQPLALVLAEKGRWDRTASLRERQTWSIDSHGVAVHGDSYQTRIEWPQVVSVRRTASAYVILTTSGSLLFFDVSNFESPDDAARFELIVRSHVPNCNL